MLSINDLNLQERTILIFGKGRKERIIYISSDEVLRAIKEYLDHRRMIPTDSLALFLNKKNKRLSIYSIENIFKKYCKKARIKKHYTPHCLRHTMANQLLNADASPITIQELLGHDCLASVQRYCRASNPKVKRDYFKAIDTVIQRSQARKPLIDRGNQPLR